jgi:hypothetical protein
MGFHILKGKCLSQEVISVLIWLNVFCPISCLMLAGLAVDLAALCLVWLAFGSPMPGVVSIWQPYAWCG